MVSSPYTLKEYQVQTLQALRNFLEKAVSFGKASTAFFDITKRPYYDAPQLPGLPYVCMRVPTGGGKTILAAHSIGVAADSFLRTDTPTVLWLVPSQTIRDQTLATLRDRTHANRQALSARFGENVQIMGVSDALYSKRADYDGGVIVIVATLQAFRVEETEGRKVYDTNGELMDHFDGLAVELRDSLDLGPSGEPIPSLANVLRLRRPMVIVDEAHNARTDLSFDTLARLNPALIVEFTATPVTPEEHNPAKATYASNVLHYVSATELKAADMIKLPIILRGRSEPKDTIGDAIAWLDELASYAGVEEMQTGEFIRPVMLIQAEPKSKDRQTLHAEEVKKLLLEDFRVPEQHVAIATGELREIDSVDLFDRNCSIRFIITQQALREGWDFSFAYVLCSVAEQKSTRAVEQILGRVLRLPHAKRKQRAELNRAYAFATTSSFQHAAKTLQDGLVSNGFERMEADSLVKVEQLPIKGLESGGSAIISEELLPEHLDAAAFKRNVESVTGGRVKIDLETGRLRAYGALSDYDRDALLTAIPDASGAVQALVHKSRGARLRSSHTELSAVRFVVPRLAVPSGGGLRLFDRTAFLDLPWKLEDCDPSPIVGYFQPTKKGIDEARLDVDTSGRVTVEFVIDLHQQLSLVLQERGWTKTGLINWLDRRLPFSSRRDITRLSSTLFISKALGLLENLHGMSLETLARAKFRLVEAFVEVIADHRKAREALAFQRVLLPQSGTDFLTSSEVELVFEENGYSYNQPYRGSVLFNKHLFRVVGDLEASGEEHECAVYIDRLPEVETWVRNTVRQPQSFWLQTASDRFYPDFLVLLKDGRVMAVEYKGAHLATAEDAQQKKLVGELWADRSNGKCLFLMVDDRHFAHIDAAIH